MTTDGHIDRWRSCRSLLARFVRFTGRTLRDEWQSIVVDPVRCLTRRGLSALLLGFVAAVGVVVFHDIAQHPFGALWVRRLGGVTGDLPLWLSLLRTPVSLYVPALDLPVWAGLTSLFLSFALAELLLGRTRTLAIAYATTVAGTLVARVMIALGPGWWGLGLPPEYGHVLDTGPSAAVVGLFTYVAVVRRAPVVFTMTGGSMVWESVAVPNLAGREHLIAVGTAIVLGLLHGRRARLRTYARSLLPTRHGGHVPPETRPGVRTPAESEHHGPVSPNPRHRAPAPAEARHRAPAPAEPRHGGPVPAEPRHGGPVSAESEHRAPVPAEAERSGPASVSARAVAAPVRADRAHDAAMTSSER